MDLNRVIVRLVIGVSDGQFEDVHARLQLGDVPLVRYIRLLQNHI